MKHSKWHCRCSSLHTKKLGPTSLELWYLGASSLRTKHKNFKVKEIKSIHIFLLISQEPKEANLPIVSFPRG